MPEEDEIPEVLSTCDNVSLLERIVGKRQSIIFALLIAAFGFTFMNEAQIASVLVGAVVLIINDYIKDVNEERQAI